MTSGNQGNCFWQASVSELACLPNQQGAFLAVWTGHLSLPDLLAVRTASGQAVWDQREHVWDRVLQSPGEPMSSNEQLSVWVPAGRSVWVPAGRRRVGSRRQESVGFRWPLCVGSRRSEVDIRCSILHRLDCTPPGEFLKYYDWPNMYKS